jgi:hypothetical protein
LRSVVLLLNAFCGFSTRKGPSRCQTSREDFPRVIASISALPTCAARSRANSPVPAPFKVELLINLKTAKAFGLTVIEFVLLLADEVDRENFFAVQ